ncbi:LLM class flavin-dependent oxidoreductase [Brevibacillus panacihumi]|uniref:LLM class flavin-dependent oxidoreductase n=1 Tax=Brevibacillus panacihumi TaxID=497735 RepID=A0A3M8CQ56_9BACL|nr:LLM class flavin-dependent oxidoreductase [Brevibacillus panacihumi]RNB77906.1 LLM class flavin-dependent oxidoreductase [Brevibacillus panacihumi]
MAKRQMSLGVFMMGSGHHIAAWRHPNTPQNGYENIDFYKELAKMSERGKLDMLFISDALSLTEKSHPSEMVRFEPLTLISALSAVTERIGLVATVSTTYNEPFNVARKFASIDHLSKGRAGWNIVTSYYENDAYNFSKSSHPEHDERYAIADEFVEVVKKLWNSWEDDALIRDKEAGVYFQKGKLHTANHVGKYFQVKGPLNASRPIQGHPVLIQAGSSPRGKNFAAKTAEVIFTAQQTLEEAQVFYRDIKETAKRLGRNPDHIKILPGVSPIVGRTEEEARAKYEELQNLIPEDIGLAFLSDYLGGLDLSHYDLDSELPDEIPATNGNQSRRQLIIDLARREKLTIRQLYKKVAGARGHRLIFGSPEQIADQLQEWFNHEAADGFNLLIPYYPTLFEEFIDQVIPVLQQRGLFRKEYEGNHLRDHLGLPRPEFFVPQSLVSQ